MRASRAPAYCETPVPVLCAVEGQQALGRKPLGERSSHITALRPGLKFLGQQGMYFVQRTAEGERILVGSSLANRVVVEGGATVSLNQQALDALAALMEGTVTSRSTAQVLLDGTSRTVVRMGLHAALSETVSFGSKLAKKWLPLEARSGGCSEDTLTDDAIVVQGHHNLDRLDLRKRTSLLLQAGGFGQREGAQAAAQLERGAGGPVDGGAAAAAAAAAAAPPRTPQRAVGTAAAVDSGTDGQVDAYRSAYGTPVAEVRRMAAALGLQVPAGTSAQRLRDAVFTQQLQVPRGSDGSASPAATTPLGRGQRKRQPPRGVGGVGAAVAPTPPRTAAAAAASPGTAADGAAAPSTRSSDSDVASVTSSVAAVPAGGKQRAIPQLRLVWVRSGSGRRLQLLGLLPGALWSASQMPGNSNAKLANRFHYLAWVRAPPAAGASGGAEDGMLPVMPRAVFGIGAKLTGKTLTKGKGTKTQCALYIFLDPVLQHLRPSDLQGCMGALGTTAADRGYESDARGELHMLGDSDSEAEGWATPPHQRLSAARSASGGTGPRAGARGGGGRGRAAAEGARGGRAAGAGAGTATKKKKGRGTKRAAEVAIAQGQLEQLQAAARGAVAVGSGTKARAAARASKVQRVSSAAAAGSSAAAAGGGTATDAAAASTAAAMQKTMASIVSSMERSSQARQAAAAERQRTQLEAVAAQADAARLADLSKLAAAEGAAVTAQTATALAAVRQLRFRFRKMLHRATRVSGFEDTADGRALREEWAQLQSVLTQNGHFMATLSNIDDQLQRVQLELSGVAHSERAAYVARAAVLPALADAQQACRARGAIVEGGAAAVLTPLLRAAHAPQGEKVARWTDMCEECTKVLEQLEVM